MIKVTVMFVGVCQATRSLLPCILMYLPPVDWLWSALLSVKENERAIYIIQIKSSCM